MLLIGAGWALVFVPADMVSLAVVAPPIPARPPSM